MMLIRPIQSDDLDGLIHLANNAGPGLTTLPKDEDTLKDKINQSLRAFDEKVNKPRGETYIFVLEDSETKKIYGTSGIASKVGGFDPFYSYKLENKHYRDESLKVDKTIQLLCLKTTHNGPSEICSLFLSQEQRKSGLGRLLSLCRFLFMSEFPNRFDDIVISELRGVSDESGRSPFWDCVGKHFFNTDFSHADSLSGLGEKGFIKNLMPEYPIYVPMLPLAVQNVIGQVHPKTEPAKHLLEKEGFHFNQEVDIFDAGPTVEAKLQNIRTVKNSKKITVSEISEKEDNNGDYLVSNTKLDFRACCASVFLLSDGSASIAKKTADALEVNVGDMIRYIPLRN